MSDLKKKYKEEVVSILKEKFNYKSIMQVPCLEKIVLNMGVGETIQNSKAIVGAEYALTVISGQKPKITKAKKSIASFKLREGMPIGCMVTLRGRRMFDFLERLIYVALPRVRDFRGVPLNGFDGRGNYTMGIKDQIVFPEVDFQKVDKVRGMDITFVTSALTNDESFALLEALGIPFRKRSGEDKVAA
jgi:large subunit ribosomal protein L5